MRRAYIHIPGDCIICPERESRGVTQPPWRHVWGCPAQAGGACGCCSPGPEARLERSLQAACAAAFQAGMDGGVA
jgi:hypothetical protein